MVLLVCACLGWVYSTSELGRIHGAWVAESEARENALIETLTRIEADGIDVGCYENAHRYHVEGC